MYLEEIPLNSIETKRSPFNFTFEHYAESINSKIKDISDLPIYLWQNSSTYNLFNGWPIYSHAKSKNLDKIQALIFSKNTSNLDLVTSLLSLNPWIFENTMHKINIVSLAIDLGSNVDIIKNEILPILSFTPSLQLIKRCQEIHTMDQEIKNFCIAKKFSLKQICYLNSFSKSGKKMLVEILGWREKIAISGSSFLQIANDFRTIINRDSISWMDLKQKLSLEEIVNKNDSPKNKLTLLKNTLHKKCNPTVFKANQKTHAIKTKMESNFPKYVSLNWDKSREETDLILKLKIKNIDEINDFSKTLQTPASQSDLKNFIASLN